MAKIFDRRYEVLVGNSGEFLRISNENGGAALRVAFMVQHDYGGKQSYAEISIYGLKTENEEKIFGKYRSIILQAGYRELYGPIFKGQITNVQRERSGPGGVERCIKLFCRTAASEIDQSFVNITFGPNTPYTEIIRACAAKFGKPIIFQGDFSTLPKCLRGYILNGNTKSALNKLAKTMGFQWTIENEVLLIIKNGFVREGETFSFSARTGMKGSPTVTDIGVNVTVALNPAVQIGRLIEINSVAPQFQFAGAYWFEVPRSIGQGQYEVARLNHVGDSHSDTTWETQIECFRYNKSERQAQIDQQRANGIL